MSQNGIILNEKLCEHKVKILSTWAQKIVYSQFVSSSFIKQYLIALLNKMGNKTTQPCIFCDILENQKRKIILQSQQLFAFYDITKSSAQQHVLICTKKHIKNALQLDSPEAMYKMREFGEKVMNKICDQKQIKQSKREFKFGFHLPPYNSVYHIHLHGFLLPFSSFLIRKIHFGWKLYSIEETERKWKQMRGIL